MRGRRGPVGVWRGSRAGSRRLLMLGMVWKGGGRGGVEVAILIELGWWMSMSMGCLGAILV